MDLEEVELVVYEDGLVVVDRCAGLSWSRLDWPGKAVRGAESWRMLDCLEEAVY